jgi:hypothetical protein
MRMMVAKYIRVHNYTGAQLPLTGRSGRHRLMLNLPATRPPSALACRGSSRLLRALGVSKSRVRPTP